MSNAITPPPTGCSQSSVADVLEEPLGRQLAAQSLSPCRVVDLAGHGPELGSLQIAALRVSNLRVGGAPLGVPAQQILQGYRPRSPIAPADYPLLVTPH